jgi:hypothetical protein
MAWEHRNILVSGLARVRTARGETRVPFRLVALSTGRSRMSGGVCFVLDVDPPVEVTGSGLLEAVKGAGIRCREAGLDLRLAGALEEFRESGLSAGSGWGYLYGKETHGAVYALDDADEPRYRRCDRPWPVDEENPIAR